MYVQLVTIFVSSVNDVCIKIVLISEQNVCSRKTKFSHIFRCKEETVLKPLYRGVVKFFFLFFLISPEPGGPSTPNEFDSSQTIGKSFYMLCVAIYFTLCNLLST